VTDLRIGQIVAEGRPTEPSFTVDLSPGPYRLRIRTLYANGEVSEWNQRDFEIFRPAVSVVPPAATVDATPVVQWMVQSGADHYQVQVTDRSGQVLSYRSVGIRETDHRIATPLPPGEYQLWVRSHYSDGSRSLWGMGVSLSIGAAPHVTFANGTLNWNRPVGTTSFEILLQRQNPDDLRWTTVVETDYYFQTSLPVRSQPAGQYRFWGRATRSEAGDTYFSNWSRLVRFELV